MNHKIINKILATMLVTTLTFANIILLGVYASETYAASETLEKQGVLTNNENVEFDAYFKTDSKQTHSLKADINAENTVMYLYAKVKKGYLKNASISIYGKNEKEESNFALKNSDAKYELIQNIDSKSNKIALNQIDEGKEVVLEVPITMNTVENFNVNNFSKDNTVKITGTYVNEKGKEISIQKEITLRLELTAKAEVTLKQEVQRYLQTGENEVLLQTKVEAGLLNNTLPIEQTKLEIVVPTIKNIKPSSVDVLAYNTYATNGQEGVKFSKDNWTYDEETGKITITVKNEKQNNIVSWKKACTDEYVLTYVYEDETLTDITSEKVTVNENILATIKAYNSTQTEVTGKINSNVELEKTIGQLILSESKVDTEAIGKGLLYTKSTTTNYTNVTTIDVGYAKNIDKIVVENIEDKFVTEEATKSAQNSIIYKTTKINKENFEKILGAEGKITIKNVTGEELASIDKNSVADDNGDYTYTYETKVSAIKIETTKPVSIGKLKIENQKEITGNTTYKKSEIAKFISIEVESNVNAYKDENIIDTNTLKSKIALVEPTTKFEAEISKANLSTVIKNENVEIRVILKTNGIDCDLYKNPTVEIELPSYIEKLEIKDINLLFDEELKIDKYETYKNEAGNTVIKVTIKGEDTKYNSDNVTKGANLVINTDITVKELTPTTNDITKVYVTNQNATSYETPLLARTATQKGYVGIETKAVAPEGIVTINKISGYNKDNETVTSMSGEQKTGKLEIKTEAKTAKVSMNIINNNTANSTNINILGRLPVEGNKSIINKEDLGSNLTTTLASKVAVKNVEENKVTIYYSENKDATNNLQDDSNAWTKEPNDLSKVKSYLVVFNNDYEMVTGTNIELEYSINIPADLSHNKNTYATYAIYYTDKDAQTIKTEEATKVGLTTGEGAELEVVVTANVKDGAQVQERDNVTYKITVKNVGKTDATNVKIDGTIKQIDTFSNFEKRAIEFSETIDTIKAGESKTVEKTYQVQPLTINSTANDKIVVDATVSAKNLEKPILVDTFINEVIEGYFKVDVTSGYKNEILENEEAQYKIIVNNVNANTRENVVVTFKIPESMTYKNATDLLGKEEKNATYDEASRTLTWKIDKIEGQSERKLIVEVNANQLNQNETSKDVIALAKVNWKDKEISSNELTTKIIKKAIEVKISNNKQEGTLLDNEKIEYYVTIKNTGSAYVKSISLTSELSDELIYKTTKYNVNGKETESRVGTNNLAKAGLDLEVGQTGIITIVAKPNKLKDTNEKEISNKITVSFDENIVKEETIKHILKHEEEDVILPDGTVQEKTYSISGVAWLDSTKDGKKAEDELTLGGIDVMLINASTGEIIKDSNGKNRIVTTDENGKYIFEGVKKGKYIVVFLHDASQYSVTTYKAEGVIESENSNAISMKLNINGTLQKGAVSDTLTISSSNIYNINLGLIVNPQFDLSLNKVVTKITVANSQGTTTHNYENSKLAKIDINPKYIGSTNVIVEYKITVTNEGAVAGYAKKIVDYVPEDMKFSSELNKDWYQGEDGNLYTTALSSTILQPGETREITLILTRKMTEDNTGIVNNKAEIAESYNDLGMEDIDSMAGNKAQGEDDMSMADVVISPKTGEIITYTILTITIITILGTGIYLIKKKVLG